MTTFDDEQMLFIYFRMNLQLHKPRNKNKEQHLDNINEKKRTACMPRASTFFEICIKEKLFKVIPAY